MQRFSCQLALKGEVTAFDCSSELETLVVSTRHSMVFYNLHEQGKPRQIIHYEQPQFSRQLRFQKLGQKLIATISGKGIVSLWDPVHTLKPLTDCVHTDGIIDELQWSMNSSNVLAGCNDSGLVTLWDVRTPMKATHSVQLDSGCKLVDWSPSDPFLVSVKSGDDVIFVWDVRKMPASVNSEEDAYRIIEFDNSVLDYAWDVSEASIIAGTDNYNLQYWQVYAPQTESFDCKRIHSIRYDLFDNNSKILVEPTGKGLVVSYKSSDGSTNINMVSSKSRPIENTSATTRDETTSVQYSELAVCNTPLLGMKWVFDDMLASPNDPSQLILLTNSGILHKIEIPPSYWFSQQSELSSDSKSTFGTESKFTIAVETKPDYPKMEQQPKYSLENLKSSMRTSEQVISSNNPQLQTGHDNVNAQNSRSGNSFKPDKKALAAHQNNKANYNKTKVIGPLTFLEILKDEIQYLNYLIYDNYIDGLLFNIDRFSRKVLLQLQIPNIDSFTLTTNKSFALRCDPLQQYGSRKMSKTVNLTIKFPLKYANFWRPEFAIDTQISFENFSGENMAAITEELSLIAEDINNRDPTAIANKTVTDLVTHNDRKIYGDGATMEDLQAERDALFPLYADVLLVQTALHFKQRVLQIWERQVDAERMKFSYSNIISSIDYDEKNATVAEYEAEDLFMKNVAYDLIEPRAYKVPLPASSGGKKRFLSFSAPFPILLLSQSNHDLSSAVFTARGELLLYGGSKLESKKVKNSGKIEDHHGVGVIRPPSYSGFMNYRKSYASLLVKRIKRSAEEESKRTELSSQKNLGAMERSRKNTIVEYNEDSDEQDSLEKSVDDVEDDLEEDEKEEDNMEEEHDMEEDEGYQFSFETEFPVDSPPRKRKALSQAPKKPKIVKTVVKCDGYEEEKLEDESKKKLVEYNTQLQLLPMLYVIEQQLASLYLLGPLTRMQYEPLTEAVDIIDDHFEAAITKQSGLSSLTEIDKSDQIDVKAAADMMTGRISACKINAAVARKLCPTNHSLYQFWCLLSVVIEVCGIGDTESLINWSSSALGSSLLYRLVNFIREIADLQTFATMICVLGGTNVLLDLLKQYYFDKPGLIRKVRIGKTDESIDPSQLMIQAEEYLYSYSELLYRWGEPLLALEIRKHIMPSTLRRIDQTFHKPLQLMFECSNCESRIMYVDDEDDDFKYNELSDNDSQEVTPRSDISSDEMGYACTRNGYLWCKNCNYFALNCSICLENVQGMFSVCRLCGHGGHFNHMQHWFEKYEKCPTGCGCDCGNQRELRDASDIDSTASNAMLSDLGEYPRGHSRTNTADGAGLYYEKMRYNFSDYTYNNFTDLALDEHTFADNFDDNY